MALTSSFSYIIVNKPAITLGLPVHNKVFKIIKDSCTFDLYIEVIILVEYWFLVHLSSCSP